MGCVSERVDVQTGRKLVRTSGIIGIGMDEQAIVLRQVADESVHVAARCSTEDDGTAHDSMPKATT